MAEDPWVQIAEHAVEGAGGEGIAGREVIVQLVEVGEVVAELGSGDGHLIVLPGPVPT